MKASGSRKLPVLSFGSVSCINVIANTVYRGDREPRSMDTSFS